MTDAPSEGRLTGTTARRALEEALGQVGLDGTNGELIRLGENAMFVLPQQRIVVRIARSVDLRDRVQREVAMAEWLQELDFPAVRVVPDLPQVVEADGRLVTFWRQAEELPTAKTLTDLGVMLRRLHELPAPPFPLPTFDPFSVVPARLDRAEGTVPPAALAYLRERLAELSESYAALKPDVSPGLIHGDAHRSNLLASPTGILLLDFEVVADGLREWDLTPTALAHERFGLSADEYAEFVSAYGWDVTGWDGYRVMANMRELTMTTWLMQNVTEKPAIEQEFADRVADMQARNFDRVWRVF